MSGLLTWCCIRVYDAARRGGGPSSRLRSLGKFHPVMKIETYVDFDVGSFPLGFIPTNWRFHENSNFFEKLRLIVSV